MWIVPEKTSNIIGLIEYDFSKKEEGVSKSLPSNIIFPDDKDFVLTTFSTLKAQARSNVKSHFVVGSVNLAPNESMTDEQLVNSIEKYLEKINMKDYPVYISKHTDKDHIHAHFIASRIDFDGKMHNEKGVFFRKDAKEVSNEINQEMGFAIIDNELTQKESQKSKSYQEHAVKAYALHRYITQDVRRELLADLPISGNQITEIYERRLSNDEIRSFLGEKEYSELFNHYGSEKLNSVSFIQNLKEELNSYYEISLTKADFINAVNNDPNLYAREIQDKEKSNTNEKVIVYGIKFGNQMKYVDEKKLPLKFKNKHLNNIYKINRGELRVLSHGQQKIILKRKINKIASSSKNLDDFFHKLEEQGIGVKKTFSGDRLSGYSVKLNDVSSPEIFKASQVDRNLTVSRVENLFGTSAEKDITRENTTELIAEPTNEQDRGTGNTPTMPDIAPSGGVTRDPNDEREEPESNYKKRKRRKRFGR